MVIHGEGFQFCCKGVEVKEEETQEESGNYRGVVGPRIWLLCAKTARSRCRVEEKTREHENHNSES